MNSKPQPISQTNAALVFAAFQASVSFAQLNWPSQPTALEATYQQCPGCGAFCTIEQPACQPDATLTHCRACGWFYLDTQPL